MIRGRRVVGTCEMCQALRMCPCGTNSNGDVSYPEFYQTWAHLTSNIKTSKLTKLFTSYIITINNDLTGQFEDYLIPRRLRLIWYGIILFASNSVKEMRTSTQVDIRIVEGAVV